MVFYFGSVFSFFTLYVSCDILVPAEKIRGNLSGCWRLISVVLMIFVFLSFPPRCNVIGSDLFFPVRVIMDLNVDVKHIICHSFSLYRFCNIVFPFPLNFIPLYMKSPSSPRSVLSNTDNLWVFLSHSWHRKACQNGFAQHLEHLLFYGADTSSQNASGNTALHISALYNKASMETDSLIWSYYYHNYHCCFAKGVNPSLSLSWTIRKAASAFFCTGEQIRRQRTSMARPLFR